MLPETDQQRAEVLTKTLEMIGDAFQGSCTTTVGHLIRPAAPLQKRHRRALTGWGKSGRHRDVRNPAAHGFVVRGGRISKG